MIGSEDRVRQSTEVLTQEVDGAVVLLNPDNGEYYSLDEVGGRIWALCDGTRTVAEIISLLYQEYEVPLDVLQADTLELLQALMDEQLVVESR
jgi:hypothetical protein